jgi:hypothetical protein
MDMQHHCSRVRRATGTLALTALLIAAAPVAAQELAHSQFVPVVVRAPGVGGTLWVTDVTVYNATDSQLVVATQFLLADQINIYDPTFPDRFTLEPRQTLLLEDVLNALYGIEDDAMGSILFTVDPTLVPGNPDGARILASTRVYNVGSPDGTFGQSVPALSIAINASGTPSVVTGARNDSRFRSNLGIVSLALITELNIHYRVRDAAGVIVAEGIRDIHPASMSQFSFASLGVPQTDGPLTVELWMDEEDVLPDPCATNFPNMFIAYVSKVDGNPEGTGDAEYLYAAPTEPYSCRQ